MGKDLGVGDKAPGFKLPRDGGGSVSLADFQGKKLVLYFYPRADTPGCTRESIDFSRTRLPDLSCLGTAGAAFHSRISKVKNLSFISIPEPIRPAAPGSRSISR